MNASKDDSRMMPSEDEVRLRKMQLFLVRRQMLSGFEVRPFPVPRAKWLTGGC